MLVRTQKEIDEQIKRLEEIRPSVRPFSIFGDSNLDKLDAMVIVLQEGFDEDDILAEWPDDKDIDIRSNAQEALDWMYGETENDDLAEDWPTVDSI